MNNQVNNKLNIHGRAVRIAAAQPLSIFINRAYAMHGMWAPKYESEDGDDWNIFILHFSMLPCSNYMIFWLAQLQSVTKQV